MVYAVPFKTKNKQSLSLEREKKLVCKIKSRAVVLSVFALAAELGIRLSYAM